MKKRFLAVFLALVLSVALFPAPALAADTEPTLTGAEMVALLPSERPEVIPPDSVSLPWNEEDEERTFREIVELTQSLTAGKTTETEKARAIFDWVSQNIEYDYTAYGYITAQIRGERLTEEQEIRASQAENPGCTFLNRRGVCGGYSALTLLMHGLAGLPTGYISCELNNLPHQGNAVYADGRWILLDSTNKWWDMSLDQYPVTESITWWDGIFRMRIYSTGQVSCFVQKQYRDISSVTIPDSVNTLDDSAFADCTKLTSVIIPSNVIYLKNGVFKGCTALTSVDIPDSVTNVGTWTFWDCTALTSVTIPDSVTKIGQYTFDGCTALAHVDIPNSVTEIETNAFKNCTALTEVTIPGSMAKIAGHTFEGCTALTDVTFRDGLTDIEAGMFWGCSNLKRVAIPASVTSIGQAAFYNCPNLTDVYYGGSEAQWDAIEIKMFNSPLARGSTTRAAFHYNTVSGFGDVNTGAYYAGAVRWAVANGVTTGKTATAFAPDETCTHAQILTFLWRAAGEPESSAQPPIAMKGNEFYYKAVKWAAEKGMVGTDFDPNASCNRAYAVLYIWQASGSPAPSKASPFTDVPASWSSAPAAAWAAEQGVTTGATATTFNPGGICTRGQIVTFLYRAYGK